MKYRIVHNEPGTKQANISCEIRKPIKAFLGYRYRSAFGKVVIQVADIWTEVHLFSPDFSQMYEKFYNPKANIEKIRIDGPQFVSLITRTSYKSLDDDLKDFKVILI